MLLLMCSCLNVGSQDSLEMELKAIIAELEEQVVFYLEHKRSISSLEIGLNKNILQKYYVLRLFCAVLVR